MAAPISTATITAAVDALSKWKTAQSDSQNPQLLPQDDLIYLILTLKKIPQKGGINGARTNAHKFHLPHPLISPESFPELCLIVDDRPNSGLSPESATTKIKAEGIPVTKVITLSDLKNDYKPFESKRKLCDSYEMFFADKRVIPFLPKLLGKHFFKKKKLPLPVDLGHKSWKEQIERWCSSGLLFLNTGTCSVIRVAKESMGRDEIVENVGAAIDGVVELVPKRFSGVRSLHLKFSESVALPLYQSLPDTKLRIEGVKETTENDKDDKKQRKRKGRGSKKSADGEDEGEKSEKDDLGGVKLVGKKRKVELNVEKLAKNGEKAELVGRKRKGGKKNDLGSIEMEGKKSVDGDLEGGKNENGDLGNVELAGRKRKGGKKSEKNDSGSIETVDKNSGDGDLEGGKNENGDLGIVELVGRKRKGFKKNDLGSIEMEGKKGGKNENGGLGSVELAGRKRKGGSNAAKKKAEGGSSKKKEKKKGRSALKE